MGPQAAFYSNDIREFILRYDDVIASPDPNAAILEFLHSTYASAAELGHWDRSALERTSRNL